MSAKKPRAQCAKCPWKQSTDPRKIPGGYCEHKHRGLTSTIAESGSLRPLRTGIVAMACHESPVGRERPCVGWLIQQLGPGNNIALRLAVMVGQIDGNVRIVGPQHERLEDTMP